MVTRERRGRDGRRRPIGRLGPGCVADIAMFDGRPARTHRAVIDAGVDDVVLVLRGGKPLYGDADLMAGLVPRRAGLRRARRLRAPTTWSA